MAFGPDTSAHGLEFKSGWLAGLAGCLDGGGGWLLENRNWLTGSTRVNRLTGGGLATRCRLNILRILLLEFENLQILRR